MADDSIPEWDISPLVESTDSNDIKKALDSALRNAKSFEAQHKGRIAEATPEILLKLYLDYDALWIQAFNPYVYSYNSFSADASDSERTDLFEYARRIWSEVESTLTFVRLESSKMLQERPDIVDNPTLSEFKHSLGIIK